MKGIVLLLSIAFVVPLQASNITIVGCGYVGLTMAAVFSRGGHTVTCVDVNTARIDALNNKKLPLYEPQLNDYLFNQDGKGSVKFVSDVKQAADAEIFYICVGTPTDAHGDCDLSFLYAAFNEIVALCEASNSYKIVCVKSTVPPGTMRTLYESVIEQQIDTIEVVYNPEFMREGCAIQDIYHHNPLILASQSHEALDDIEKLYKSFLPEATPVLRTNFESAELIKYAWNSFSAIRIAYVNELAMLCRLSNADIFAVIKGFSLSEKLLPTSTLKPGPGYGGSCFPKDTASFCKIMEPHGYSSSLVHQAIVSNKNHIDRIVQEIVAQVDQAESETVTLLGLSFKANTDDIRCAPSLVLLKALTEKGITIKAYDPKAMPATKTLFPHVHYCDSAYQAVSGTDCIVVLTEWDEFKKLDFDRVSSLCNKKVIFDLRNLYNSAMLKRHGFEYSNMGALDYKTRNKFRVKNLRHR